MGGGAEWKLWRVHLLALGIRKNKMFYTLKLCSPAGTDPDRGHKLPNKWPGAWLGLRSVQTRVKEAGGLASSGQPDSTLQRVR